MDATAEETFYNDVFSYSFNCLRYLGQWELDDDDPVKKRLYGVYKTFILVYGTALSVEGIVDLYQNFGDWEKVFFNLCTTFLITGITVKNFIIRRRSDRINKLRWNLFQDGWKQRNNPENLEIRAKFVKLLIFYRQIFYITAFTVVPIWLSASLLSLIWGPRELPFQVWMPFNDLEDNVQYFCGFVYQMISSIFIVSETIHADLGMFSLVLQISAQYRILAKNVSEIDKIYLGEPMKDVNKALLNHRAKKLLKKYIKRQLVLLGYVKEVEDLYNKVNMMQLLVGFILSIGNGLELMMLSTNLQMKVSYQLQYTLIVLADVFMCCNIADILMDQARKVAWSLYDLSWFDMDNEIRRYLLLILLRAQKIQPLTLAKMFGLNVTTFLGLLKNVYSWLALFRQIIIKN